MKPSRLLLVSSLALAPALLSAAPRASASYNVIESIDSGGRAATSPSYSVSGSVGGVTGPATSAALTTKAGYLGQTPAVLSLQITSASSTVNEGASLALAASQLLDDQTTSAIAASNVSWSAPTGPLSVSAAGLATAGTVFQNTGATAQAAYGGLVANLSLSVINVNNDDLPGYSGDGVDDAWQFQYFGLNNPQAAPNLDPDGDGQSNLLEAAAGLSPLDPSARFLTSSQPTTQAGQINIVFGPVLPGRTYIVETSVTLGAGANWTDLTGFTTSDNGSTRTVTDPSGGNKFYRVRIIGP